jgi:hypothetical protein
MAFAIVVGFGLASAPLAAPPPRQAVAEAEQAYNANDLDAALEHYREIAQKAPHDPEVLYNLGTVHARAGDRGRATWRYLQALQLRPRDRALQHNLTLVAPEFQHDMGVTPIPPLNAIYWRLTANEWTCAAAAATLAGLLLLSLYFWLPPAWRVRLPARRAAVALFVIALLTWPPALLRYRQEQRLWRGVVVVEGTVARTDPDEKAYENFALPAGKIVRVLDQPTPGWLKIAFAGDRVGFVQRDRVEFL